MIDTFQLRKLIVAVSSMARTVGGDPHSDGVSAGSLHNSKERPETRIELDLIFGIAGRTIWKVTFDKPNRPWKIVRESQELHMAARLRDQGRVLDRQAIAPFVDGHRLLDSSESE